MEDNATFVSERWTGLLTLLQDDLLYVFFQFLHFLEVAGCRHDDTTLRHVSRLHDCRTFSHKDIEQCHSSPVMGGVVSAVWEGDDLRGTVLDHHIVSLIQSLFPQLISHKYKEK